MAYDQTLVFGTVIFIIITYVASYCIKNHRFRNLVFWAIYFVAIAPNLIDFSGFILREGVVNGILMVFFASSYVFYLESIYLVALVVMVLRDWVIARKKTLSLSGLYRPATEAVKATIEKDLALAKPETVRSVLKAVDLCAKEQVPMDKVLQTHNVCLEQSGGNTEKETACLINKMDELRNKKKKQ